MWFVSQKCHTDWKIARKHLRRSDPVMRDLIARVGPCLLSRRRDYFVALCQTIFTQQVSMAVAAVLFNRFQQLFPAGRPTPAGLMELSDAQLAAVGISRQKRSYLRDLGRRFVSGQIPTRRFARMSDDQIIESLDAVKGIGRWSAEMFLIFVLNRPDVLPVDDLGIRKAVQKFYELPEMPGDEQVIQIGEIWRPWRTAATWYLWRALSNDRDK